MLARNETVHHHRERFACIAFASKTTLDSLSVRLGGSAANAATAITRAGGKAQLISGVGKDALGAFAVSELKNIGVDTRGVKVFSKTGTGIGISIISASGEKSTLVYKGANNELSPKDLSEGEVKKCGAILLTSLPSKQNYALFLKALSLAKRFGKKTVFAPSITMLRERRAELSKLRDSFDLVIMNGEEARFLTGKESDFEALKALPGKISVVTLGKKGALMQGDGKTYSIAGSEGKIADSTGAGDAFCGVFACEFLRTANALRALKLASAASAIKLGQMGAQLNATRGQLERFAKAHAKRLQLVLAD